MEPYPQPDRTTVTSSGVFVSPWLARPGGGTFSLGSSDADWNGHSLSYPQEGTYTARIWIFDSGGLVPAPRTFTVTVNP
jgi:hypothetical protein